MWILILAFLRKHLFVISIGLGVLLLLWYVHHKWYQAGFNACKVQVEKSAQEELDKRMKEYDKLHKNNQYKRDKILKKIKPTPEFDKINSCILSSDPLQTDCIR